ncbi:MAG TPA: hypothetical protein VF181_01935 [Balneolaceae bacterium]
MKLLENLKTNFIFASALLLLFVVASPALAQDNQGSEFDSWDANSDSTLSQDEFTSGVSDMGYYDEWDADGNGEISEEEWNTGIEDNFDAYDGEYWDMDGDGVLSEEEFENGLFDTVDEDDDDSITEDEFDSWYDDGLF